MGANLPPTPQVQNLRKLGLTDMEIAEVLATDKEIDQGAKLFELDAELQAGAKKARRADRTDNPKKTVRERKEDTDKQTLLNALCGAIDPLCDNLQVVNPEREFLFTFAGRKFKVVLSAPRT